MSKRKKIHVKVGDTVNVISGFYKNKTGEILKISKKTGNIVVQGVNFRFRHLKPKNETEMGEIQQLEAPIHHSNVKLK